MRRLTRPEAPECLNNEKDTSKLWKKRLYDKPNAWKNVSREQRDEIVNQLLKMSNGECAFCGRKILGDAEVDHFLPKSRFPLLALCWENLLPLCRLCNGGKSTRYPKSITASLAEVFWVEEHQGYVPFEKKALFEKTSDRLIDPSFDDPELHIVFEPKTRRYVGISDMGKLTVRLLFTRRSKHFDETFERIYLGLQKLVNRSNISPQDAAEFKAVLTFIHGYSFVVEAIYNFLVAQKKGDGKFN